MAARSLAVCGLNPWPATSGARQRIALLTEALKEFGSVDEFHFSGANAFEQQRVPSWIGRTGAVDKPVPATTGRIDVMTAAARAYARGLPRQFGASSDHRAAAVGAFNRFVAGRHYAVVLVVREQTLVLADHLRGVSRDVTVVDIDDLEDLKLRQRRHHLSQKGIHHLPAAALMSLDAVWWRRLHRRLGRSDALPLVCTDSDARILRRLGVESVVVPNAYQASVHSPAGERTGRHYDAVFVGSPLYRPNRDAVHILRTRIVPAMREQDRSFRLHVVGGCAGPRQEGITYHGFVDDLNTLLGPGRLALVPIVEQSGMSVKVLDAACRGATIIATPQAVRGLAFVAGRHYIEARTADEFVTAVRHARSNPDLADQLGQHARAHVLDRHSSAAVRSRVVAAVTQRAPWLVGASGQHPQMRAANPTTLRRAP